MTKQKIKMEPGKKYRGTAYVNEYGEIHFDPSQPSEIENRLKLVYASELFSIYETGKFFKISLKLMKETERSLSYKKLLFTFQSALTKMSTYL